MTSKCCPPALSMVTNGLPSQPSLQPASPTSPADSHCNPQTPPRGGRGRQAPLTTLYTPRPISEHHRWSQNRDGQARREVGNRSHHDSPGSVTTVSTGNFFIARKQLFFLPLAFFGLIIYFIPLVNILAPVYWFLLTAWMGALQYTDYAYDNHKISFADMQRDLKSNKLSTFTMGAFIAFALCVPLLNLIIPPAAVCAGTKYYLSLQKTTKLEFSRG